MTSAAFSSPFVHGRVGRHKRLPLHNRLRHFSVPKRQARTVLPLMSSIPEPERTGSSADDEALNMELQKKVDELFGSRQNVSIDMETDSGVQFTVRKQAVGADYRETKAAWSVLTSVAVLSVIAGVAVTALFYSGAIHGSEQSTRRYDMPTYGKSSYINPYELLEEDRQLQQFQEAQSLSEQ